MQFITHLKTGQDNMVWKKIFLNLLTASNLRWIKQKATETPSQEAAKTCEKLTILIESRSIVLGITLI